LKSADVKKPTCVGFLLMRRSRAYFFAAAATSEAAATTPEAAATTPEAASTTAGATAAAEAATAAASTAGAFSPQAAKDRATKTAIRADFILFPISQKLRKANV
jgi:hypothetical protein